MPDTTRYKWTYPSEDQDPYFEGIEEFFNQIDSTMYAMLASAANIIIPPSTVDYDPSSGKLTWNADWEIPIMATGFILSVKYGPDGSTREIDLEEGDRVYVVIPASSSENLTANFSTINGGVTAQNGFFTLGMRKNNKFYANIPTILS